MKRFIRKIPLAVVVAGLAALLAYGFWPVPVDVDVVTVEPGSFDITVNDDGETRIREKYIVSAPVAGKLLRVELHAGDVVQHGETVLARIEPGDPTLLDARSEAEAEARVRAAQASRELAVARRERANEALNLARHDYDRAHGLLERQAMARSEFDRIEHQRHMAEADVRSAEFAVRVAEFEHELASAALIRTRDDTTRIPRTFTVVSPVDGRVLRVFNEDAGVLASGTQLMELGDARDLEMEIDVLSTEAVRIKPGARVIVDHWGGEETLEGIVRVVEPSAFLKVSALGVEEKRVNIIADFRGENDCCQALGDGYRIEVRIVVDSATDVVTVPAGVLFRRGKSWHAFRLVDGKAQLCPVRIGKTNGLETQVIEGVSAGDRVVLHPTDNVVDGVALRAIDPVAAR